MKIKEMLYFVQGIKKCFTLFEFEFKELSATGLQWNQPKKDINNE